MWRIGIPLYLKNNSFFPQFLKQSSSYLPQVKKKQTKTPQRLFYLIVFCYPLLPTVCVLSRFSRVQLLATLWTVAHQVPLSMGFSRQEYWSGLPCPPLGDLPKPGIEPRSAALQVDYHVNYFLSSFFTTQYFFKFSELDYKLQGSFKIFY